MKLRHSIALLAVVALLLTAPVGWSDLRYEIDFPDILGYTTLKCDLHMHTVFSDGDVWPPVRVEEAWREGLDAISITDHVDYTPHEKDVAVDHNRPYDLAVAAAKTSNIVLVRGTEITRDTPPGHFNSIFLSDNRALDEEDPLKAVEAANRQGGFVFYNHPHPRWYDVHTKMLENGWLHGVEVVNGGSYYPHAHRWCLEKGLTMMGASDIHDPAPRRRSSPENHRAMTLVFAKDRSLKALKEALFEGRTAVWHKDQLIGSRKYLEAIFKEGVKIGVPHYRDEEEEAVWVKARNHLPIDVRLERTGDSGPRRITLAANATTMLQMDIDAGQEQAELKYVATNFLIGPEEGLPLSLKVWQGER
jgi:hypothetical protein